MAVVNMDQLINGMGNNSSRIIIEKASIANAVSGAFQSLFRATGQPGQGAIPTTAAVCSHTLLGSMGFTQQTAPATSYLAQFEGIAVTSGMTIEVHDRLMHMGGLSGTSTVSQTVNLDVHANIATDNLAARIGDANYSDIQWWMEWYADTGATASNATVNVTYNDGTSGNLTIQPVGGTIRASRMINLNSLIPAPDSGKYIRDINTVINSASTGTLGNFGFTATRYRGSVFCPVNSARYFQSWSDLALPEIFNSSCLFPVVIAATTSTGVVRGTGKIIHG